MILNLCHYWDNPLLTPDFAKFRTAIVLLNHRIEVWNFLMWKKIKEAKDSWSCNNIWRWMDDFFLKRKMIRLRLISLATLFMREFDSQARVCLMGIIPVHPLAQGRRFGSWRQLSGWRRRRRGGAGEGSGRSSWSGSGSSISNRLGWRESRGPF